ncbi:hypothetical protein MRB53_032657 [Persea americana]|uniref:Uncharacterized protein n=1 Tax=Persea americana TaxID=3435 RepID=A0ACC2KST9_PERAE|nr:hypothetical protein MRB53_032657 [Persea americana]
MDCTDIHRSSLMICVTTLLLSVVVAAGVIGDGIYLEWKVSLDSTIRPVNVDQPLRERCEKERERCSNDEVRVEKGRVAAVCRAFGDWVWASGTVRFAWLGSVCMEVFEMGCIEEKNLQ